MKSTRFFLLAFFAISIFSCDDNSKEVTPTQPYDNGVIVLNAGNFLDNNGTLSLLSRTTKDISLNIFQKENARNFSGNLSDYTEAGGKGIILVDNSSPGLDGIEIVDAGTFKSIATIPSSEIENPRQAIKISDTKVYISAWDATGDFSNFYKNPGYVAVLNLETNKIIKKIPVQNGAESIALVGNEVFVGSADFGQTKISVIDITTDAIKTSFETASSPEVIGLDLNNKLWVFAGNKFHQINTSSKTIEKSLSVSATSSPKSPSSFAFNKEKSVIYFTYSFFDAADDFKQKGETFQFDITKSTFGLHINKLFNGGLSVDPVSGNLYSGLVPSFKQAGFVFRYKSDGTLVDSVKAEIAPGKFFFKD